MSRIKTFKSKIKIKHYALCGIALALFYLNACSSDNKPIKNILTVEDPIEIELNGIDDKEIAVGLSKFLDSLAKEDKLPKTVLFTLNPKDNYVLGTMLGNFQTSEAASKIQFGSAWWFNDNYDGMRQQLSALANLGVLSKFVGMITDSRSFLSYPRHEYFRRILCELIGEWVEEGKYPEDVKFLSQIVADISFNNAEKYFGLELK